MTGKTLKKLRTEYKMTQQEFAEELGIKSAQISVYESGKRTIPEYTAKAIHRMLSFDPRFINERAMRLLAADPDDKRVMEAYRRAQAVGGRPLNELCWLLYQEASEKKEA